MTKKKRYQVFTLEERDEALSKENSPEVIEMIQKKGCKRSEFSSVKEREMNRWTEEIASR